MKYITYIALLCTITINAETIKGASYFGRLHTDNTIYILHVQNGDAKILGDTDTHIIENTSNVQVPSRDTEHVFIYFDRAGNIVGSHRESNTNYAAAYARAYAKIDKNYKPIAVRAELWTVNLSPNQAENIVEKVTKAALIATGQTVIDCVRLYDEHGHCIYAGVCKDGNYEKVASQHVLLKIKKTNDTRDRSLWAKVVRAKRKIW